MGALIRADDLGQDYEDHPVAEGQYDVTIKKSEYKANNEGTGFYINLMLTVDNQEGASPFNHMLSEPKPDDKDSSRRFKMRQIKRFLKAFRVSVGPNGFDMENDAVHLQGLQARVLLKQEERTNRDGEKTGDMRNIMQLPPVSDSDKD